MKTKHFSKMGIHGNGKLIKTTYEKKNIMLITTDTLYKLYFKITNVN